MAASRIVSSQWSRAASLLKNAKELCITGVASFANFASLFVTCNAWASAQGITGEDGQSTTDCAAIRKAEGLALCSLCGCLAIPRAKDNRPKSKGIRCALPHCTLRTVVFN